MGDVTPKGYPYPLGTDRVADGDDAIHDLAAKVDELVPARTYIGYVTVPFDTAAPNGSITLTYPAGRFTAAPRVNATAGGTSVAFTYVQSATASSVVIGVRRGDGGATFPAGTNVGVHVIAVQMLSTSADG